MNSSLGYAGCSGVASKVSLQTPELDLKPPADAPSQNQKISNPGFPLVH